jgi:integrase
MAAIGWTNPASMSVFAKWSRSVKSRKQWLNANCEITSSKRRSIPRETFVEVTSPTTTFKQQAQWWLDEMRAGRIVSRKKRKPIKPATLAGYQAAVNWLNESIGSTPLVDIKNEVAKQLVIKMQAADLADKTIVNYFQVVKAVVASAVSSEGEQLYPRNWNFHFIGLPVIDERKQRKPSLTASEVEQILARAKGRYRVLFALLAGTGLRIGEASG